MSLPFSKSTLSLIILEFICKISYYCIQNATKKYKNWISTVEDIFSIISFSWIVIEYIILLKHFSLYHFSTLLQNISFWIWIQVTSEQGIYLKCRIEQYYILFFRQWKIWRMGHFCQIYWKERDNRIIEYEWIPWKKVWDEVSLHLWSIS